MKKIYVGVLFGIFAMASFLAMNLYTSTSFPGFGGNETCNNCHNQPAFAKTVDTSFKLGDWANSQTVFEDNSLWSANEVPLIQTNDRNSEILFVRTQFLTNSTHFMTMMEIEDGTPTNSANTSATSDKFGLIFNIDSVNFTVGDFLTYYNSTMGTPIDQVLDGQMALQDGHADLWWIDTHTTNYNSTGKAMDYYISSNYVSDGASNQDVSYALWYGLLAVHGPNKVYGYRLWFVRALTNSDTNDVQFKDGDAVRYAVATWDDSQNEYHHSSFDQMLIVGNEMAGKVTEVQTSTVTETKTETGAASGTTSSFTVIFVLAGLAVGVPLIAHMRRRRN